MSSPIPQHLPTYVVSFGPTEQCVQAYIAVGGGIAGSAFSQHGSGAVAPVDWNKDLVQTHLKPSYPALHKQSLSKRKKHAGELGFTSLLLPPRALPWQGQGEETGQRSVRQKKQDLAN